MQHWREREGLQEASYALDQPLRGLIFDIRDASGRLENEASDFVPGSPLEVTCVSPPILDGQPKVQAALPTFIEIPVSGELASKTLGFGAGWWSEEPPGRWLGSQSGAVSLVLPKGPERVLLTIKTATFSGEPEHLTAFYKGKILGHSLTGQDLPFTIDVTDLPRNAPILINFQPAAQVDGCPAKFNRSDDRRKMLLMLKAVYLTPFQSDWMGENIGHGGGRFMGSSITNSLEALQANLLNFRVFEIDLNWTSDSDLVCIHDWKASARSRLGYEPIEPLTKAQFKSLIGQSPERPRNCDLESLAQWMAANPWIRVVTDVKSNSVAAHRLIAERHPDLVDRFIPQAFKPQEISAYRRLGYGDVIFTLYRFGRREDRILEAISKHKPSAVAMPVEMARSGLLRSLADTAALPIFVHTVNDVELARCLLGLGAAGLYSDDLSRSDIEHSAPAGQDCLN